MEQTENQLQLDEMGTIGPGRYLLTARQNKKLRTEDVAFELRLTPSQVIALEEDDYSRMPEVTYVRGYLRNYARLLGLSPDDILLAHARITRNDDLGQVAVTPVSEREIHAVGTGVKLLSVLILVAIIGASVYWYLGRDIPLPVAESEPEPVAPVIQEEVPTGISKLSFAESGPVKPAEPTDPTPVAQPESDESSVEPPAETALPVEPETPTVVEEPTSNVNAEVENAAVAVESDQPDVTEAPVDTGLGQLVIGYQKSCWTDIRDANGKKLVYRTIPAGETISVEGETPLTLFFGFAVGIDLTFNGNPVDLKEHTRGVFARLTLDR